MNIELVLGRRLSQAPPKPGWAGKWPEIDDFRSYRPPKLKNQFDCVAGASGRPPFGDGAAVTWALANRPMILRPTGCRQLTLSRLIGALLAPSWRLSGALVAALEHRFSTGFGRSGPSLGPSGPPRPGA